jgi:hypothetical protein
MKHLGQQWTWKIPYHPNICRDPGTGTYSTLTSLIKES